MLAYDALLSLAQTVEQIILHNQCPVSPQEKKELTCISEHVNLFLQFLEKDAEKGNSLEGRISSVATDADDIIANFMSEQICPRNEFMKIASKRKFIHELKEVTNEIASIADDLKDASSSPTSKDDIMVGFDEDLMAMKALVCGESSKLEVLPIFGMGGIGKTTLARHVYHDQLITESFDVRAWFTVSQDYSVKEIFAGLVVTLKHLIDTNEGEEQEKDGVRVYKALKGRKYLIVVDDIWSTKAWDDVRYIFPDDGNGSRILLTTRLADVAAYPDPYSHLHKMQFMDADKSWDLLRQKAFNQQHCPPELEKIGKEIARSCRGLPLAIVVVAGLLSSAGNSLALWKEIAENVNSAGNAEQEQIREILSLSYSQLPRHLKPCFLYMAAFPEDHRIHAPRLIKLWVAEGFCRSQIGSKKSSEEVGEEYVEDLVKRSLVLVNERKSNGKIKSLSMHDLMRDLCIRKAQEEKFLVRVKNRYFEEISLGSMNNQRRASITMSFGGTPSEVYAWFRGSTVRTLIFYRPRGTGTLTFCAESLRLLKALNVLDTTDISFFSPPPQIFELIHLRYFAFPVTEIPVSISNLQNLQTLIIPKVRYVSPVVPASIRLPMEIWRLSKLRHLHVYACVLPCPEGETSVLKNLQTLSTTVDLVCTKRILDLIPNVKRLGLSYSNSNYDGDFHLDNLGKLRQVESLTLTVSCSFSGQKRNLPLWENLNPVFPTSLRKLTLSGSGISGEQIFVLPQEGLKIIGSLPDLEVLKLKHLACQDSAWETNEGGFPQLKFLLIEDSNLQHWMTESSHFPSLKSLLLHRCEELREIPDGIGDIPTLELIEVDKSNKSLVESAKRIQEEQQSFGNEDLQVRIFSDHILLSFTGKPQTLLQAYRELSVA